MLRETLRTATATAVRGREYDVVPHQQAAMPELLSPQDVDPAGPEPGDERRSAMAALRALKESRTDVEALEFTEEQLRHLQGVLTKAADQARETMSRYADWEDTTAPHPVREDDQRAHRPQQPGPHRGPEAGR
ncbi:hypothetical protein [Streptomyces sannanensis]|uniref:hypothetical protein n=1 Tax=Streptomyces sannanensis TaxID=285536 RepID=UPI0031E606AA